MDVLKILFVIVNGFLNVHNGFFFVVVYIFNNDYLNVRLRLGERI